MRRFHSVSSIFGIAGLMTLTTLSSVAVVIEPDGSSVNPAHITVFDGVSMQDYGVDDINSMTNTVPNINHTKVDSHMNQVVFRGVGGIANMNKSWIINIDGVTTPYVAVDTFLDVERIDLMRGSQGSLTDAIPMLGLSI